MKTIALISSLTFVVIFGTILVTSGMLGETLRTSRQIAVLEQQQAPARNDSTYTTIAKERDQVQRARESLAVEALERDVEQKRLAQLQQKLTAMIDTLTALQQRYNTGRDGESAKLAKVYAAMKPAKAAPILSSLDLEIVIGVLRSMKARQAAKILASMDPRLAAEISARMSNAGGKT